MLKLEGVVAGYGRIPILHDISMQVRSGEIACIIGSNGSGKSTLVRCISGLLTPWKGKIYLAGDEITQFSPDQRLRQGISAVLQGRTVFGTLTVRENLELGGYLMDNVTRRQRIEEMFEMFPMLRTKQHLLAGSLSSGWQQVVEMSRALMIRPRLFLLDEPTLGLSPMVVEQLFQLMVELNKHGQTIIIIEQNAKKVLEISDYAFVLDLGRIRLADKAANILSNKQLKRTYLGFN